MKKRRIFYDFRFMENPNPYYTRKGWLRYKDKILGVNRYNSMNIDGFGIKLQPKRRHRRSMRYVVMMALIGDDDNYIFTREAKTIGRRKRGKWLYTPKRVILRGNKNDKNPIFI